MARKFTNVETFLIIIFLVLIMVTGIIFLGADVGENPNSALDNDSIEYIANLQGVNLTQYRATRSEIEESTLLTANTSQGNPKDLGLDFLFGKGKGIPIEIAIKGIFSFPGLIIVDLLRFNLNDWEWIITIFNWLFWLLIILAIIFLARGINT